MIGYLLIWLYYWNLKIVPVVALVGFIAFGGIIVYCSVKQGQVLFPERWSRWGGERIIDEKDSL